MPSIFGTGVRFNKSGSADAGPQGPTAPSGLVAVADENNVDLSWSDNSSDETAFELWRSLTGTGNPVSHPGEWDLIVDDIAINAEAYSDEGLEYDTEYFYIIKAKGAIEDSVWSSVASITTDAIAFLLADDFTADAVGPLPSPHSCDIIGQLVLVQTGGNFSKSGGKLIAPLAPATWDGLGYYDNAPRARASGLAYFAEVKPLVDSGYLGVGFLDAAAVTYTSTTPSGVLTFRPAADLCILTNSAVFLSLGETYAANTTYKIAQITCDEGAMFFIKGGVFTTWTFLFYSGNGTETNLRAGLLSNASQAEFNQIRVSNGPYLPAAILNDGMSSATESDGLGHEAPGGGAITRTAVHGTLGISTDTLITTALGVSPAYSEGIYETGQSDGMFRMYANVGTHNVGMVFRYEDIDNHWFVNLNNAANEVQLVKRTAGIETSDVAAVALADNSYHRVQVSMQGTTIKVFVDSVLSITKTGAVFNQTKTKHGCFFSGGTSAFILEMVGWKKNPTDTPAWWG